MEWYSSQIKECPNSSLKDTVHAKDAMDVISAIPILKAYDQRMALAEKAVKSMKKKLDCKSRFDQSILKIVEMNVMNAINSYLNLNL